MTKKQKILKIGNGKKSYAQPQFSAIAGLALAFLSSWKILRCFQLFLSKKFLYLFWSVPAAATDGKLYTLAVILKILTYNKKMPEIVKQENKYLSKSIKIYKFYGFGLLTALFTIVVLKPLIKETYYILDFLIGFPVLVMIILAPFGLYYSWRSYKEKESNSSTRLKYFLGHFIFSLFAIFFILTIISDFKQFL